MSRGPPLVAALFCVLCGSASASDYYITSIQGDYETIYGVSPASISDPGNGVKRGNLLAVHIVKIEMEEGVFVTTGSLDVMVIEVKCDSGHRQFKEDSEYVQFSRSGERIDKTAANPSKDWTPVPAGSAIEGHANFLCQWPKTKDGILKMTGEVDWDFVDRVTVSVERMGKK